MKPITKITLLALGLVLLAGLAGVVPAFRPSAQLQAAGDNVLTFNIACDYRTGSPGFFAGHRGDVFIVTGKNFLPGLLSPGANPMIQMPLKAR